MSVVEDFLMGPYGWLSIFAIIIAFTSLTVLFYLKKDKYDPEPVSRIILAFIYGIFSIVPAIILSLIAGLLVSYNEFLMVVVVAPVVEETVKLWFVIIISKHDSFDGPLDGLIYGAMVGAGFAAAENLLYGFSAILGEGILAGIGITTLRSLFQIIGHPFYTGIAGIGVGEFKVGLHKNKYNRLWFSMLMHGLWNLVSAIFGIILILFGLLILIIVYIKILRDELRKAIELDRSAYERGYYDQKQQFLDQKQSNQRNLILQQPWRQSEAWGGHQAVQMNPSPENPLVLPNQTENQVEQKIVICRECGSVSHQNDRFCRECGYQLIA